MSNQNWHSPRLAIAQHALENNHHIGFDEARFIDRATNYWDRLRREAIEIKLQPNNCNRDNGLHISKAWGPAISVLWQLRARGQYSTSARWLKRQDAWLWAGRPGFDPGCRRGGDFTSLLHVQTGPGVHSTSYKMSPGEFLRGVKVAERRTSHPISS